MEVMPDGYDIIMEASGAIQALRQGFHITKLGGTIVQVGIIPPEGIIPLGLIFFKELNYIGSFRFCNVFEEVLKMCCSGNVKVDELISRTFPFKELDKAITYAGDAKDTLKIQVKF